MRRWVRVVLTVVVAGLLLLLVGPFLVPVPPLEGTVPPEQLADPDSRFVEVNGLQVHYKTTGQGEPTMVLLHSFGASLFSWREVMAPLSELGTVFAFDRPAFGLTGRPLPNIPLRSQKPVGVIQEAYGLLIAHYAVRSVMHEAAVQNGLNPDRLSFINAVRIIRDAIPEFQMTAPEQLSRLYQRLLNDIARHRLPEHENRSNPRVVKRKMSKFKLKRKVHLRWPQPTKPFREAVVILK